MTDPVKDPMDSDPELDSLLGAYALDALDTGERARVEEYLAHNRRARDEVDELRESAAALALATRRVPSRRRENCGTGSRRRSRRSRRASHRSDRGAPRPSRWTPLAGILAVAAAVALLVLALEVVSMHGRLDKATGNGDAAAAAAFDHARSAAGAREVALTPAHGTAVAQVVLLPDGHGYLKNDGHEAARVRPDVPAVGAHR